MESGGFAAARQHGLPPVVARDARVLILGSFPGEASLAARQYYAHPRNHFWRLLGATLGVDLVALPYEARLRALIVHQVALWDAIVACRRHGSLDAAIRDAERGDIEVIRRVAPMVETVCFNGQTAARAERCWREAGFAIVLLPSSSPAYTLPFAAKLEAWQAIGAALNSPPGSGTEASSNQ